MKRRIIYPSAVTAATHISYRVYQNYPDPDYPGEWLEDDCVNTFNNIDEAIAYAKKNTTPEIALSVVEAIGENTEVIWTAWEDNVQSSTAVVAAKTVVPQDVQGLSEYLLKKYLAVNKTWGNTEADLQSWQDVFYDDYNNYRTECAEYLIDNVPELKESGAGLRVTISDDSGDIVFIVTQDRKIVKRIASWFVRDRFGFYDDVKSATSVEASHTINSINKARQVKIPSHAIMMMHTDITTLLETEYPGRDFEVMVQPNNDEYRPAIVIVLESWIDYPDMRLTYKVCLDDPTVIYYGEEYTDESEFDVNSDLSEKIRVIVEKYLRPFMKYEEIQSAEEIDCYELDDHGFAQLYGDKHKDAYAGVRIPNEKYANLPEEIKELLGEYGLPRAEDNYFHTFVDVGERYDLVSPEHAEFLAEYGICKDSKQFENVWMWDNW